MSTSLSEAMKAAWANDPVRRAMRSQDQLARWRNPEIRARYIAAFRAAKGVQFTPEMDDAIKRYRCRGESWQTIADRVGVSYKILIHRVDELELPRRIPRCW